MPGGSGVSSLLLGPPMPLAVSVDAIRSIHRMHRQLQDLRGRIAAGPRAIDASSKDHDTAAARLHGIQEEVKKARLAGDQKQLQLRSMEVRIRDGETKLNAAKTNREYQLLGEQIAADQAAKGVLEDEILETLDRVDQLKGSIPPVEAEVKAAAKALDELRQRVAGERGALDAEVARVSADLARAEEDLPADLLDSYRRVVKSKGADAMAVLEGVSCGGCFQQLPPNTVAELTTGRVVSCRSCGRLLYASGTG